MNLNGTENYLTLEMKTKVLLYFLTIFFCGNNLFGKGVQILEEGNSIAIGTSFNIEKGVDLTFSGSLYISDSVLFKNEGRLFFNSPNESEILLPSGDFGTTEIGFTGAKNYELFIQGEELRIGKLSLDMQGATVSLNGNLVITNKLELNSGIIDVKENSLLLIDNAVPDSVEFSNTPISNGYVSGFITRKIAAGKSYQFPVGDAAGFHPFLIEKAEKADLIRVSFDNAAAEECISLNPTPRRMVESLIGWRVESDSEDRNKFYPGLSLLNSTLEDKASMLEIFYMSYLDLVGSTIASNGNLPKSTINAFFVLGSEQKSYGLYAFSQVFGTELVNFIYVGSGNQTRFVIPDQSDFSNVKLNVYNRLGGLIFKGDHYGSEFDARNYPDGTYFYELTLEKENKRSFIRNFIEIKHEK